MLVIILIFQSKVLHSDCIFQWYLEELFEFVSLFLSEYSELFFDFFCFLKSFRLFLQWIHLERMEDRVGDASVQWMITIFCSASLLVRFWPTKTLILFLSMNFSNSSLSRNSVSRFSVCVLFDALVIQSLWELPTFMLQAHVRISWWVLLFKCCTDTKFQLVSCGISSPLISRNGHWKEILNVLFVELSKTINNKWEVVHLSLSLFKSQRLRWTF